jgi:hypothetical protein
VMGASTQRSHLPSTGARAAQSPASLLSGPRRQWQGVDGRPWYSRRRCEPGGVPAEPAARSAFNSTAVAKAVYPELSMASTSTLPISRRARAHGSAGIAPDTFATQRMSGVMPSPLLAALTSASFARSSVVMSNCPLPVATSSAPSRLWRSGHLHARHVQARLALPRSQRCQPGGAVAA